MNLFRESFHTIATQVFCLLFGVGTSVVLNRVLGPAGKGEFVSYLFISQLIISCTNLGLAVSGSYFLGKGKYREGDIILSNLFFSFILGGLGIVLGFFLFNLYRNVPPVIRWLVLFTIIPGLWLSYIPDFFLGKGRIIPHNNWNLSWHVTKFTLISLFLLISANKLTASLSSILTLNLIFAIISLPILSKIFNTEGRVNLSYLRDGVNFGYKIFIVDLLAFMNYRFDILLLRMLRTPEEVGYYSTAVYMVEILWLIPRAVSLVLYSKFVTDHTDRKIGENIISITMLVVALTGIGSIFLVRPIITLLYTDIFLPAFNPYLILLPGVIALVIPKLLIAEITGRWGRPDLVLGGMLLTVTVNIGLNLLTIPRYGIIGAAASSTTAYIVQTLFFIWIYRKTPKKHKTARYREPAQGIPFPTAGN